MPGGTVSGSGSTKRRMMFIRDWQMPSKRKLERPMDLHHPLLSEFPEFRSIILKLSAENHHFSQVSAEYDAIDDRLSRIEEARERATEQDYEELKRRRVMLKDLLYHEARAAATPQPRAAVAA